MEVKEIINSPFDNLTNEELIFVVTEYIKERKGVDVDINIHKNINNGMHPLFIQEHFQQEVVRLEQAYGIACEWFLKKEHNGEK